MNVNDMVVKSNALIESKGKMNLLEQKIIASVISEIKKEDKDFNEYIIDLKEFQKLTGTSSNGFYEQIERAANALMDKKIRIEKENGNILLTRYLSSAEYKKGASKIEVSFDPKLKPYLLELAKNYTQYQLKNVLELKSTYAFKIYELLKQVQNMKSKYREITLNDLREYLGIKETEYSRFTNFKSRVLEPAKEEINNKTDIWLDYEVVKGEKNKVIAVRFTMTKKVTKEILDQEEEKELIDSFANDEKFEDDKLKCGLSDISISKVDFYKLLDIAIEQQPNNVYEYICLTTDYVLEKKPKHPIAYLKNALKKNYINF